MYTADEIDVWRTTSTRSLEQLNLLCLKIYDEDFDASNYDDNILYYDSHKILLADINIREYSQKLSERENWSFDGTPFAIVCTDL
jgi:CRISPR/Cas system CMR subunit Cmr4 (Cas7 group RAMP superfamily)